MEVLIYRTTVINHLKCFLYLPEEVSHLKILLPCFSSVTHTMWWLAPNFSDGAEFEFAAPSIRLAVLLNGPNLSTPTPPSLGLVEWMTVSRCGGRCWLTDGLLVWCPVQRRSHQRRSRKRSRSFEDDDEGHLIYHSGDMLRARCIEYIPFFSNVHSLSHSLVVWFISKS